MSRSKGHSVVAASAYRNGVDMDDERIGKTFDYTRRRGVMHSEIMAPENTPDWMRDREQLWNAVEKIEIRKDSQLARNVELSLPHELPHDKRVELLRGFVQEEFVAKGMIADVAVHAPHRDGDQRNFHAHVLLTMRTLTGDGFGGKAREWNSTEQLSQWREAWANHTNRMLEREGIEARVDHRSLKEQGIDREPELHIGWAASEIMRRGGTTDRGSEQNAIHDRNAERDSIARELKAVEAALAVELSRDAAANQNERPDAREPTPATQQPTPAADRPLGRVAGDRPDTDGLEPRAGETGSPSGVTETRAEKPTVGDERQAAQAELGAAWEKFADAQASKTGDPFAKVESTFAALGRPAAALASGAASVAIKTVDLMLDSVMGFFTPPTEEQQRDMAREEAKRITRAVEAAKDERVESPPPPPPAKDRSVARSFDEDRDDDDHDYDFGRERTWR